MSVIEKERKQEKASVPWLVVGGQEMCWQQLKVATVVVDTNRPRGDESEIQNTWAAPSRSLRRRSLGCSVLTTTTTTR